MIVAEPTPMAFTVEEAARYLGISEGTLIKALRAGTIPARRLGRRWIISKAALDDWLRTGTSQQSIEQ